MSRLQVDRFEGDLAVLVLDGRPFELPRALLPEGVVEGDFLVLDIRRDTTAGDAAREATRARRARLSRDDDGGDFSL